MTWITQTVKRDWNCLQELQMLRKHLREMLQHQNQAHLPTCLIRWVLHALQVVIFWSFLGSKLQLSLKPRLNRRTNVFIEHRVWRGSKTKNIVHHTNVGWKCLISIEHFLPTFCVANNVWSFSCLIQHDIGWKCFKLGLFKMNCLQGVITKCIKSEAGVFELDGKIR